MHGACTMAGVPRDTVAGLPLLRAHRVLPPGSLGVPLRRGVLSPRHLLPPHDPSLHADHLPPPSHSTSLPTAAELLSRVRLGWEELTADDWTLLESRVCGAATHGSCAASCCTFEDRVVLRKKGKARRRTRPCDADAEAEVTKVLHCPITDGATVIAALRDKVGELNERHITEVEALGTPVHLAEAVDYSRNGRRIEGEEMRELIDKRARGQQRCLALYEGMSALLTFNEVRPSPLL